jgi:uridine phosphorylase
VHASEKLLMKFLREPFVEGINISAPGFYGPQGRSLRLGLAIPELNELLEKFRFEGSRITNYEMESSAIYGLSRMLGHEALTVCLLIANRQTKTANEDYHPQMERLVESVLEIMTS